MSLIILLILLYLVESIFGKSIPKLSDNVANEKYIGLTPHDLIDIAMCNNLLYDGTRQTGVMFHMIGALSQYGKLGLICIGSNIEEAKAYYYKTIAVLNKECGVTA